MIPDYYPALLAKAAINKFMTTLMVILMATGLLACAPEYSGKSTPIAKKGVIDLSEWSFEKDGPLDLQGEWEFYWEALHKGNETGLGKTLKPDAHFPIGRRWGGFELDDGEEVPAFGYATLRLKVIMPSADTQQLNSLRLFIGSADTAFKLEAQTMQGELIARPLSGGEVGTSHDSYRAAWRRDSTPIPVIKEMQIIWQISNFDMLHDGGGPKKKPRIGLDNQLILEQETERSIKFFSTGILMIMAIYHLIIFLLRPSDSAPLWFGWSCLFMGIYSFTTPHYLEQAYPNVDLFEFYIKVIFLSASFPIAFHILFFRSIFPKYAGNIIWKLIVLGALAYSVMVVLTPLRVYDQFRPVLGMVGVASGFWIFWLFYKEIVSERSLTALILLLGFLFYSVATVHDLLIANAVFVAPYIASYGLSIFILSQAVVIAMKNQQAHREKYMAQKLAAESDRKALETEHKALEEQRSLTSSFQRFVPADFLRLLGKENIQDVELGDFAKKSMSVLFSDIRSFTTLSESMSPEDNFRFLNSYLKRMEPLIHQNGGVIDKYIGDAIMATFDSSVDDSVQAAVDMLLELNLYNDHRKNSGYPPIQIGIGINTGELMLGTIGGKDRMEGTVISDAVNLAARLESLTKMYGASIAISDHTYNKLTNSEKFLYRILDTVKVKGKTEPVTIYEILNAENEDTLTLKIKNGELIEKALAYRKLNELSLAKSALQEAERLLPSDKAVQQHLQVIDNLEKFGLPEGWQGVVSLDSK